MKDNYRFNRLETEHDHHYLNVFGTEPLHDRSHPGYIKCKLAHGFHFSMIIPDQIYIGENPNLWIQPFQFLPCILGKFDDNDIRCTVYVDIPFGHTLKIEFAKAGFVRTFPDGSQLFSCRIRGPENLEDFASGTCVGTPQDELLLRLFHHTSENSKDAILRSARFRPSYWNIQGTKKLKDIGYVYLTALDQILMPNDLKQIAMASDGVVHLICDNVPYPKLFLIDHPEYYADQILFMPVYRESTSNRTSTIDLLVDPTILSPQHLLAHSPNGKPVFYEIICPLTHRIAVKPGTELSLDSGTYLRPQANIQFPDFVVVGDARHTIGLEAPYDEENTKFILKLERPDIDICTFWFNNANSDLFNTKPFSPHEFE